ncbi:transcription factor PAR2 [Argentina anserina]|uniref:transcription factor PAR2 n=1 Tax=Argentina anserina TaxID=57926 RepID=UPI00217655FD|nr:transcription factor PAR2 [Potentilla anserina]
MRMSSLDHVECSMKMRSRRRRSPSAVGGNQRGRRWMRRTSRTVRVKVRKLQMLIPGGRGLEAERLFRHTADYIMHLRFQVDVLQALSKIYKL